MFFLSYKERFLKNVKKIVQKFPNLKNKIDKTLAFLEENPLHPSLRSHRVKDRNGDICFSSWVNGDIRILWNYDGEEISIIEIWDIVTHGGAMQVYEKKSS